MSCIPSCLWRPASAASSAVAPPPPLLELDLLLASLRMEETCVHRMGIGCYYSICCWSENMAKYSSEKCKSKERLLLKTSEKVWGDREKRISGGGKICDAFISRPVKERLKPMLFCNCRYERRLGSRTCIGKPIVGPYNSPLYQAVVIIMSVDQSPPL